jgi:hypothetical protein
MTKRVFLGGTCNGSTWRETVKPLLTSLGLEYFDPVVPDWNEEAYQRELYERENCDYVMYCITPKMTGVYSIAEVIDDSNKRPEKTTFVIQEKDEDKSFDAAQMKSLMAVAKMVINNGGLAYTSLTSACKGTDRGNIQGY